MIVAGKYNGSGGAVTCESHWWVKKSISGLSHALMALEILAGGSFLLIFTGLVPLAGSGWDLSGVGLTLGLDGEIQMWRAGTASLWLLGSGEQGQGAGQAHGFGKLAFFVPFTSGCQKP